MIEPKKKTVHYPPPNPLGLSGWEFDYEVYDEEGEVNMDNKIQKVGKGWIPHGGVILKNVYHHKKRMAYDMGIIGIYVFPGEKARANGHLKPKFLVLGPPDFVQLDSNYKILSPTVSFDPIVKGNRFDSLNANFATFNNNIECQLKTVWVSKYPLFGNQSGSLFVTQKYFFTSYDDAPAHEPSGGLMAARLHPIIDVHYEHALEGWVESIRVDYRLYLNLDTWYYDRTGKGIGRQPPLIKRGNESSTGKINNAAGLFRDEDEGSPFPDALGGVANVVFKASEKPLVAEVISEGLNKEKTPKLWDNIHWWGAGSDWLPGSTPGSFWALHVHWRWGKELQTRDSVPFIGHEGEQQFAGEGYGGILTDPRVDNQILRIAVVKNEGLPSEWTKHKTEDFFSFFKNLRNTPKEFSDGSEDIVLYYSCEVNLLNRSSNTIHNNNNIFDGSFFIHGIFFPHELEKSGLMTGSTEPFYSNPSRPNKTSWERYPTK